MTLNEITAKSRTKLKAKSSSSCTVYYLSSIAWGRSVAEANVGSEEADELVAEYEEESGESCSKIGEADSSCLLDEHACYASQAYCCQ